MQYSCKRLKGGQVTNRYKRLALKIILLCFIVFATSSLVLNLTQQYKLKQKYSYLLPVYQNHESQNTDQNFKLLQEMISKNPNDTNAINELAYHHFQTGKKYSGLKDFNEAMQLIETSLKINSNNNEEAFALKAKILESQHQFDQAIYLAKSILSKNQKSYSLYPTLVYSLIATGNIKEALSYADEFVRIFPKISSLTVRGLSLLHANRFQEGVFEIEKAIKHEDIDEIDDSIWARSILARHFIKVKNYNAAKYLLSEVLRIRSDDPFALNLMGELELSKNNYAKAKNYFDQAFAISRQIIYLTNSAHADLQLGLIQPAMDKYKVIEKLARNDLKDNPMGHKLDLAKVLIKLNTNETLTEAIQLLKEELKYRQSSDILYHLSLALHLIKKPQEALTYAQLMLNSGNTEKKHYELVASIYNDLKQFDRAEFYKHLTDLISIKPHS